MAGVLRRPPLVFLAGVGASFVALVALLGVAGAVDAHDPIVLTAQQTSPAAGPLLLDGTVSFALYGTLLTPEDHRGFRARFRAGDTLTLTLLIPDIEPERSLAPAQWPGLVVTAPDGAASIVQPGPVSRFTEGITATVEVAATSSAAPTTLEDLFIFGSTAPALLDDVVEETLPPSTDGSPSTAVLLGAGAIVVLGVAAVVGLGVGVSRRRRR